MYMYRNRYNRALISNNNNNKIIIHSLYSATLLKDPAALCNNETCLLTAQKV